ncbi:hypothetical protein ACLKA6_008413 [Drosophila palustris]
MRLVGASLTIKKANGVCSYYAIFLPDSVQLPLPNWQRELANGVVGEKFPATCQSFPSLTLPLCELELQIHNSCLCIRDLSLRQLLKPLSSQSSSFLFILAIIIWLILLHSLLWSFPCRCIAFNGCYFS